jgi:hypothetical protein
MREHAQFAVFPSRLSAAPSMAQEVGCGNGAAGWTCALIDTEVKMAKVSSSRRRKLAISAQHHEHM